MKIADNIRDGEILILRGTTIGRSWEQHARCGAIMRPYDCVWLKSSLVPIMELIWQVSRMFSSLMGWNCAQLVSLATILQLWRNQVTSFSTSFLKSLSCMILVKMRINRPGNDEDMHKERRFRHPDAEPNRYSGLHCHLTNRNLHCHLANRNYITKGAKSHTLFQKKLFLLKQDW